MPPPSMSNTSDYLMASGNQNPMMTSEFKKSDPDDILGKENMTSSGDGTAGMLFFVYSETIVATHR